MHTTRAQVVAWMALAWLASGGAAQPVVRIGAEARIELEAVREGDRTRLKARLLDDQARPLAGLGLSLEARTADGQRIAGRHDLRTTREGEVAITFRAGFESVVAIASFAGDAFHPQVREEALFDLGLAPVDLSFTEPRSSVIDLGRGTHAIALRARCEAGASGMSIAIHDEGDRLLARAVTDATGVARVDLRSSQLGEAGQGKLLARTSGDAQRSPAQTEIAVVRWSATSLSLELEPQGDGIDARGVLRAGASPVPQATISIFDANHTHVASFVTDAEGRYAGALDATTLATAREASDDGRISVRASYVSDVPWLGSSESPTREAQLHRSFSWRRAWPLATPIVIGLLLLVLRRRTTARRQAPLEAPRVAGVSHGQALRRRGAAMSISFIVIDARSRKPIPQAHAALATPAGERVEGAADQRGGIELTAQAAGELKLEVHAPGFRTLEHALRAPHRGEWTQAVVRLESLRDAALAAWQPVASQLAANAESAGASTVRETLERATQQAHVTPANARELAGATEQAAYAQSAPAAEEVAQLEQHAAIMARVIEDKRTR